MSIIGLALRLSAVRALGGATLAGARVYDSAILPIAELVSNEPKPYVSISTEDEEATPGGRDVNDGDREIDLTIEVAMASAVLLPAKDDLGELVQVSIPETDAALELSLAILTRQIMACLFGRGGGAYGDAFRGLTGGIKRIASRRGAESKNGARYAARQITITVQAIAEPPFAGGSVEAGTPLAAFLAALDADTAPAIAPIAAIIRQAIEGAPIGWPAAYTATAALAGYTEAEATAIGIGTLVPDEAPAAVSEAVADPDGWIANAATVAAQLPEEAGDE